MRISADKKFKVLAAAHDEYELRKAIKSALSDDLCVDIINLAYSEDDQFVDEAFIEADVFWDIQSNADAQELVLKFFNGEDLDSKGPANPNRDYFRFNGYGNIESTDYPGDIYLDDLDDEIVDYIMEHSTDREFPKNIQDILDDYMIDGKD